VLAAGLFLGFRFGRGRLLVGLLVLVASAAATALRLPEPPVVVSLLLPLNLAAAAFLPDRGPSSRAIRTWAIVVIAEILVAAAAVRVVPRPLAHALLQPVFPIGALDRSPVGQIPLVAFLLALGVTGYRATILGEPSCSISPPLGWGWSSPWSKPPMRSPFVTISPVFPVAGR
jgi:hypothetical protein